MEDINEADIIMESDLTLNDINGIDPEISLLQVLQLPQETNNTIELIISDEIEENVFLINSEFQFDSRNTETEPYNNNIIVTLSEDPQETQKCTNSTSAAEDESSPEDESASESIANKNQGTKTKKKIHAQGVNRKNNIELRKTGKEYSSKVRLAAGKYTQQIRPAKIIGKRCDHTITTARASKVKLKIKSDSSRTYLCAQIDDNLRNSKFEEFWALKTWDAKRAYVLGLVDRRKPYKRRAHHDESRKKRAFDCYLHNGDGIKVRVCRSFFLNTLSLGRDTFNRWTKSGLIATESSCDEDIEIVEPILKQKNKERKSTVIEWLALLPKVPSHYCRSSTTRIYLESTFSSKSHLHSIYEKWCKENDKKLFASRITFMNILKQEKISIHKPRKDQCDSCYQFKVGNLGQEEYNAHRTKKQEARDAKQKAKSEASDHKLVITMDLQSVLLYPNLLVSKIYYSQKLQLHDFTIYSLNNGDVDLYVWHEGEGGVSCNEFVSCIAHFVNKNAANYQEIVLISDGCNYQNRNKVLSSELSNLAVKHKIIIEQIILEKGHTMMEADSVHSTLEALFKPPICSPGDYVSRMRAARPRRPYNVVQVDHTFFMNFENQSNNFLSIRPGKRVGDPSVFDIRALQYLPSGDVRYKLRHPNEWIDLPQRRPNKPPIPLEPLYNRARKIKSEKFLHLQELKTVLPVEYHPFYDSLCH